MLVIITDQSETGRFVRTRYNIKKQSIKTKNKPFKKHNSKPKSKKPKKIKLLSTYDFFELESLVALKCEEIGRPWLIEKTVWEEVELVRVIPKRHNRLIRYIVKIDGMTYIVDTDDITIKIFERTPVLTKGSGCWQKHKYAGSE
ncbi:MAG: hypothetical protein UZ19_OD1000026 [Parcubacteria bacterium OLB19]|nr:MAG: hypothetical protein UZ19_OD1000026 [Parcubacteria bacterium OLB19]